MRSKRKKVVDNVNIVCLFTAYSTVLKPDATVVPITGGEEHFLQVTKAWISKGLKFEVLTTRAGHIVCKTNDLDTKFSVLPFDGDHFGVIGAYVLRSIEGTILSPKYNGQICTYCATDILPDVIPAVAIKVLHGNHSRMVCWIFHLIPHYSTRPGSKLKNIISYMSQKVSLSLVKRYSNAILVDNAGLKKDLISLGFREKNITVVPLGIHVKAINDARPIPNITYDACYLGRLHVTKGVLDLIEIWKDVVKNIDTAHLAIIGGGATERLTKEMMDKIRVYKLEKNISFLGWVPRDEIYPVLKSSKVFVFPSHEEGFGIALCEAMAAGLPAVAYDLPVFREVFPRGVTRICLGDYSAFASAVANLLRDENLRQKESQDAVAVAAKYDWGRTASIELSKILDTYCSDRY